MYISEWDLHGAADYYQQLVPQGRNIHPGTWHSSMYISEWDLALRLPPAACKGEKYTPRDMAFLHIYQNGICTVLRLLPAACHKEKYTPRDMAFLHVYIRMGSTRCSAATTTSSLLQEKYTPRDMAFLMYISEWDLQVPLLLLIATKGEIYTQGHGIPHVYIRDLHGAAQRRIYTQGHGIPLYISEWDLHGA
jgi:hypothetical protein